MKGNIKPGDKIFKIASKALSDEAKVTYSGKEFKKIALNCKVSVKKDMPVSVSITPLKEYENYKNVSVHLESEIIPENAVNQPITKDRIISQFSKTNDTPFEFSKIDVDLDDNLYIPKLSAINALRREALERLEFLITRKLTRVPIKVKEKTFTDKPHSDVKISLALLQLNNEFDYTEMDDVDRVYIPLRCFRDVKNKKSLREISSKFDIYLCLPMVINLNYSNLLDTQIQAIVSEYNIKGFLFSSIGELGLIRHGDYKDLDIVSNYNLNVFNDYTLDTLSRYGTSSITLSPELSHEDIKNLKCASNKELIVYGRIKVMTAKYCLLGSSNRLLPYLLK